jgi:peptidoglycan/LPS O-acetylase OafA/YrhL
MKKNIEFKINNFDLLRLFAATEVIVDHYIQHLNKQITPCGLKLLDLFPGVPIFFIISGYLISASYERNNNLKNYFRNRALRIFPGLWVCIIITVIVITLTGVSFLNKEALAWFPSQLIGVIYTPHFLANYGFGSYNGSLWTIPVELQFYILLPILYRLVPKDKINYLLYGLLILFIALNLGWLLTFSENIIYKLLRYSFIPHFYIFLIGVILQRLKLFNSPAIYNKALYWVIGYVSFSLILSDYIPSVIFSLLYTVILAFCLLSIAYTLPEFSKKLLRTNDISYGIYIYHGLILTVIVQLKLVDQINIFEVIGLSYLVAFLSWILVEKPFIQMKSKTIRRTV